MNENVKIVASPLSNEHTITETHTSTSSVKLNISTKGVVTFEVKVYDQDPDNAVIKAKEIFENLKDKYTLGLDEE